MSTKSSILIVDDDPYLMKTLSDILKAKGYAPTGAAMGKAALDRVEEGKPVVALIDLRLEDMPGLEVMREIKERSPGTECIVLTGYASQSSAIEAVNLGAYSYIQKPHDVEQLLLTIRRAIEKQEAEEALRESEEKYRTLIEQSLQGLVVVQDFRIVFANATFAEISAYIVEELLSLVPEEVKAMIHPEDQSLVWGYFRDRLAGKPVSPRYEYRGIRKDGTVRWLEMFASRIEYRGKPAIQGAVIDITERKQAEEALRRARRDWEDIFQAIGHPTLILDPEHNVIAANRAAVKAIGSSEEGLWGKRCYQVFHGTDRPPEGCPLEKMLISGRLETVEMEMEALGGIFLVSCTPVLDEAGRLQKVIHIATDITERKRAEGELRRLKEFNESIIQNMAEGIVVEDAEGYFTFVNPAAAAKLGYAPDELLGQHWTAIIPPDQHPIVQAADERRVYGKADRYELELVRKDGRRVPVLVSGSPGFEEGRFAGTLAVFTDITERKRAERSLRALNEAALAMERAITDEEIFAAVAEEFKKLGFSCAIFLTDESQSRLLPKYLSYEAKSIKAAEKLTGLRAKDFSIPIENVDVYREVVWERKTVFVENAEEIIRQILPELLSKFAGQLARMLKIPKSIPAPLIVEDKVIGVFSAQSDDLTADDMPAVIAFAYQVAAAWRKAQLMADLENSLEELKQIQAQLLQLQKMEAIGQLAAGIAHDFNNLLTPIGGFAELLLGKAPRNGQQYEYLRQIKVAAERAAALTRQLRLFTRQEKGERHPIQLNSVVEETRDLLERSIPKEITIELHLTSELWTVEADPSQISQVLMNLCLNARDAMPDGGLLTLETRNVTLDEEYAQTVLEARPGRYVRLSISDTGCGMSPEVQTRLFEPFFTTKEAGEGTGLGLAVVYGIVRGHGGFIQVYSEEGRGSTFHVYLPAIELAVEGGGGEGLELPTGTETILLVDDEEMVRELGQRVLEGCGYTVLMAENGVQALEVCQAYRGEIALVVLDVVMPEMGGRECLRRLRELDPQVKVLISTGYIAKGLAQELVAEGALGVVEKPFRLQDFAAAVRAALDQS